MLCREVSWSFRGSTFTISAADGRHDHYRLAILIIYLVMQRFIIKGITAGAVVG
jgi:hypothetical protein